MTYKKVIDAIGGGVMREAARRLGISHNTVYGWSRKGMVPECRAFRDYPATNQAL